MAAGDPAAAQEAMALWGKWMEKTGPKLADVGAPIDERKVVGAGKGEHIGGYSVLEADSADEVEKLVDDHPHFHSPDANILVCEVLPLPGM